MGIPPSHGERIAWKWHSNCIFKEHGPNYEWGYAIPPEPEIR